LVIGENMAGHPFLGGDGVSSNESIIERGGQLTAASSKLIIKNDPLINQIKSQREFFLT